MVWSGVRVIVGAELEVESAVWDGTATLTNLMELKPLTWLVHFMPYCVVV